MPRPVRPSIHFQESSSSFPMDPERQKSLVKNLKDFSLHLHSLLKGSQRVPAPKPTSKEDFSEQFAFQVHAIIENLQKTPSRYEKYQDSFNDLIKTFLIIESTSIPATEKQLQRVVKAIAEGESLIKRIHSTKQHPLSSLFKPGPLEKKPLREGSLLETPAPKVGSRELAQVLGDPFLSGSELSKWMPEPAIHVFSSHLEAMLKEDSISQKERSEIEKLSRKAKELLIPRKYAKKSTDSGIDPSDLQSFHHAITQRTSSLAVNDSFLILGGWTGTPGHTIYLEILRKSENEYRVRLYNTGGGLEHHCSIVDEGQKKFLPYYELGGITKESLCQEIFAEGLLTLRVVKQSGTETDKKEGELERVSYKSTDLYGAVLDTLKGTPILPTPHELKKMSDKFYREQISGTCTYRALMALAHTHLSEKTYQHMLYESGLRSLVGYYQTQQETLPEKRSQRLLLKKASESYMHICLEAYRKGFLTKKLLEQAYATTQDIIDRLDALEVASKIRPSIDPWTHFSSENVSYSLADCQKPTTTLESVSQIAYPELLCLSSSFSPKTIADTLKKAYVEFHELEKADPAAAIVYWEKLFEKLPFPAQNQEFWTQIPPKERESCMECLYKLTEGRLRISARLGTEETIPQRTFGSYFAQKCSFIQNFLFKLENPIPEFKSSIPTISLSHYLKRSFIEESKDSFEKGIESDIPEQRVNDYEHVDPIRKYLDQHPEKKKLLKGTTPDEQFAESYTDLTGKILPPTFCYWHRQMIATQYLILKREFDFSFKNPGGDPPYAPPTYKINSDSEYFFDQIRIIHEHNLASYQQPETFTPIPEEKLDPVYKTLKFLHTSPHPAMSSDDSDESVLQLLKSEKTSKMPLLGTDLASFLYALSTDTDDHLRPFRILDFTARFPAILTDKKYQDTLLSLFDSPSLATALQSEDFVISAKKIVEKSLELKNIGLSCWALLLAQRIALFQIEKGKASIFTLNDLHEHFNQLLSDCKTSDDEATVHSSKAFFFSLYPSEYLTESLAKEFLESKTFLAHHPLPESPRDHDIKKALLSSDAQIRTFLKKNGKTFLPALIKKHLPKATALPESCDIRTFPWCKCGEYSWNAFEGIIISNDKISLHSLPENIRKHPDFATVFPDFNKAVKASSGGKIISFDDVRLLQTKDGLKIQKQIEGKWYEYIPKEKIPASLQSSTYPSVLPIIKRTTQWMSLSQSEILCLDAANFTPSYRISIKDSVATLVEDLSSSSLLQKASITPPSPISILKRLEDPSEILVWDKKITIPRIGCTITIKEDRAYLDTPEGFWISEQQTIPEMEGFDEFLLVENEKHQKKILIPRRTVDLQSIYSDEKNISMCRGNETLPSVDLAIFDMDPNGFLSSTNRKDSLYLAYIMLATHHYDKASALLQKYSIADIKPFSDEEKILLQSMADIVYERYKNCENGGTIPNECACFLRVIAAIVKNSDMFEWRASLDTDLQRVEGETIPPAHFKPMLQFIQSEYNRYLMMLDDVSTVLLDKEEEATILSLCGEEQAQIQSRRSALQQDSRQIIFDAHAFELSARQIECSKFSLSLDEGEKFINPFRLGKHLYKNFGFYYQLAKKGDIATLQKLSLAVAEKTYGDYARLLLCVASHPESFPSFEKIRYASSEFLNKKLVNVANSFLRHENDRRYIQWKPLQIQKSMTIPKAPPLTPSSKTTPDIDPALIKDCFVTVHKKHIMSEKDKASLLKALRSDSPDIEKKFSILREDIQEGNSAEKVRYIFKSEKKEFLKKIVSEQRDLSIKKCAQLEEKLLQKARFIKPSFQETLVAAKLLAGEQTPICLNDLIAFFLKQDSSILLEKNPSLNKDALTYLNQEMMEYLLNAIRLQQLTKSVQLLDEITDIGDEKISELITLLEPPKAFLPHLHPEYLVFEYMAQITLRPDQCSKLDLLRDGTDKVIQMIMGSGKSKILAPLLAYLHANGKDLSVLIVPEALTQTVAEDMQISQGQFLHQKVRVINIDRSSDFSTQSLQKLYADLLNVQENRNCVLMTKKSISCLYLQFEATLWEYFKQNPPGPVPENLEWFQKILSLFKTDGRVLMDEVDQLLFSRHEVNFPLDTEVCVKPERLNCVEDIYHCLAKMPELLQNFSLEKFNHVKKKLASDIIEQNTLLKSFKGKDRTEILDYICGERQTFPKSVAECAAVLAILRGELSVILPLTLQKQCQTAYGLSKKYPSKVLAIPYAANNTPIETADFGNIYEQLNYTMQTYLLTEVSSQHIKPYVSALRNTILDAFKADPQQKLESILAYQELFKLVGKPFSLGDDSLIDTVYDHLKKDVHARIFFVRKYLFPQAVMSEKKVSMTACGLVSIFRNVQGFTGTPWNKDTFPENLRNNTVLERGTDGKTIALLWEHSDHSPIKVQSSSCEKLVEEFAKQCSTHTKCRAIIDSGALFHGIDNETVASMLLKKLPKEIKGIVFYKDDTQMVLERHPHKIIPFSQSRLKHTPENRFTYYDQRHTIGADIQQANHASAFITFGKSVSLRDYMQAVWRMRKIGKGQTLHHVVTDEMEKLLQERYGSSDLQSILRSAAEFQFAQEYDHTLVAAVSKRDEVLKQYALKRLLTADPDSLESQKAAMNAFLVRSTQDAPESAYGKKEEIVSKKAFREQKLKEKEEILKEIVSKKEHEQLVEAMKEQLDSTPIQDHNIRLSSLREGTEVETEREQEQEQQKEMIREELSEESLISRFEKKVSATPEFEFAATSYTFTPKKTATDEEEADLSPTSTKDSDSDSDSDVSSSSSSSSDSDSDVSSSSSSSSDSDSEAPSIKESDLIADSDSDSDFDIPPTTNQNVYTVSSLIDSPLLKDVFDKNLLISESALRPTENQSSKHTKLSLLDRPTHPIEFLCAIRKEDGTIQVRMLRSGEMPSFFRQFEQWKKTSQKSEMVLLSMRSGILNHFGKNGRTIIEEEAFKQLNVQIKFLNGETYYSEEEVKYLREWIEPHKEALKDFFLKKITLASADKQKNIKGTVLGKLLLTKKVNS